ncbi:hypothetical protein AWR27_13610 [Spirosoma montaniterrae]|uniref:Uncharacterized protein n=2 Tax=Spirosoma montaniterrae TaxID=1178516 RepID=A0A1P9WXZ1_9BACT|nr:hypothetical protein AWR27_13610 [Spirosoma montaniterrae]
MLLLLSGCRVSSPTSTLNPGYYRVLRSPESDLPRRVYVIDTADSLKLLIPGTGQQRIVSAKAAQNWAFYSPKIDIDVFTLPFKVRPARSGLPPQLNSNFNAALYAGRRLDFHRYTYQPVTPSFGVRKLRSQGFGYGLFAGIGSATINELVTNKQINYTYEGVILDVGIAAIYDAHIFNIGLAVGVDNLMDPNRRVWLYQRQPWFGVLFGLNLN